jgi:DNA helicase HerA-like ATPase
MKSVYAQGLSSVTTDTPIPYLLSTLMDTLASEMGKISEGQNAPNYRPVVLVCEEAHRYIPSRNISKNSTARDVLERIAKEGRKYGLSLGLVTQRPSDLAEGALSQCGTIVSLRLNNDGDQAFVKNALAEGGRSLLDAIPALGNCECIISGEGVAAPIRVWLDELEPHKRPASDDPVFSELWVETGDDDEMLDRVIARWRANTR